MMLAARWARCGVFDEQYAAFAGGQGLGGLQTERAEIAPQPDALAAPFRAVGMGGIFDHDQVMLFWLFL